MSEFIYKPYEEKFYNNLIGRGGGVKVKGLSSLDRLLHDIFCASSFLVWGGGKFIILPMLNWEPVLNI